MATSPHVGIIANMRARKLYHSKNVLSDGAIVEMLIWEVPRPLLGSLHNYKYSLFYDYPEQRIVGCDNERGKGDHGHVNGYEDAYTFSTVEKLVDDSLRDVQVRRGRGR